MICSWHFSEYYFDLVVAMLFFGLLGAMLAVDEYHAVIGVLVAGIMITFMLVSGIIFWSIALNVMLPLNY